MKDWFEKFQHHCGISFFFTFSRFDCDVSNLKYLTFDNDSKYIVSSFFFSTFIHMMIHFMI